MCFMLHTLEIYIIYDKIRSKNVKEDNSSNFYKMFV